MALKAMKVAKRHGAVKNVHKAKSDFIKAKAHKVKQKPSQAQTEEMDFVSQEGHENEQEEKQFDEQEGNCHEDETTEKGKTSLSGKEYYQFGKSLPEAPMAVQEARSGKQKHLARAYANQKSIESLQREDIVMPKVIMVAKCGGTSAFEQALCLVNSNIRQ